MVLVPRPRALVMTAISISIRLLTSCMGRSLVACGRLRCRWLARRVLRARRALRVFRVFRVIRARRARRGRLARRAPRGPLVPLVLLAPRVILATR